ncbi:MAG: hypothetical protein K2X39_01460, partial [Silvanigrellaceae bacterium]|nr:hypothetical protein [Silvanigrellaceae bacterium]
MIIRTTLKHTSWVEAKDYITVNTGVASPLYNPIFLKKTAKALPPHATSSYSFWYDANRNK